MASWEPKVTAPPEQPWYQDALTGLSKGFDWIHENVEIPFAAAVTSPWTPKIGGTEGLNWIEREKKEYEEWEAPSYHTGKTLPDWMGGNELTLGVKGAVELIPSLLIPSGTGVAFRAGAVAAKGGKFARAASLVQRAAEPIAKIEALPVKAVKKAISPLKSNTGMVGEIVPILKSFDETAEIIMQSTWPDRLLALPYMKNIAKVFGGTSAIAKRESPAYVAVATRAAGRAEGTLKSVVPVAKVETVLNKYGGLNKVFGLDELQQASIKFPDGEARLHINKILSNPSKYDKYLTPDQKESADVIRKFYKEMEELLFANEIPAKILPELTDELWVSRKLAYIVDNNTGEILQKAYVAAPKEKVSAKMSSEFNRVFHDVDVATKAGYRFYSTEETMLMTAMQAYHRITDKQFEKWILKNIPSVTKRKLAMGDVGISAPELPSFRNRVLTGADKVEVQKIISQSLTKDFSKALHAVNQANSVGRFFALAGDMSPFMIQLIMLPWTNPKAFGKSLNGFVRAFFDPDFLPNYIAKHSDTIAKSRVLQFTRGGTTEGTQAMARGGFLRKGPLKGPAKLLEPFQRGFEASLDVAGIEMREAFDHLCTTPLRTAHVESFINEFRGLANTARIGVSPMQRQIETAVILAPQYNRAIAALMVDLFRGNLRGELARKSVAKAVTGISAMTVAVSMAMGEDEEEIVQHLNPASKTFMTWEIAGQQIGPGSKIRSVLKLLAKSWKNPENLAKLSMENPTLQFLRGNLSPGVSTGYDVLTGEDYIGDPLDTPLKLTQRIIGENLMPIWLQSTLFEGGDLSGRATRAVTEFLGGRARPSAPYELLQFAQESVAEREHGITWEEVGERFGKLEQLKLTQQNIELQELEKKADEAQAVRAKGEGRVWVDWNEAGQQVEGIYKQTVVDATSEFRQTGDGVNYRKKVSDAGMIRRAMYDQREKNPEFKEVFAQLEEPLTEKEMEGMNQFDLARREYYQLMYAEDMYDEFGNYDWDEMDRRKVMFVKRYGEEALKYVEDFMGAKWDNAPEEYNQLILARKILKPYWDIADNVVSLFGQLYADSPAGQRMISKLRKRERKMNPSMERAYQMFYASQK